MPTLELAERFAAHGYTVVPHLSARLVRDRAHLAELVQRLDAMGVRDVFVIAGDADASGRGSTRARPASARRWPRSATRSTEIGITGYPESHPLIDDADGDRAMFEKLRYATYIASQICFDPTSRHAGSTPFGRAARGCRSTWGSREPCRGRSCCASRHGSASASRSASCASTATSFRASSAGRLQPGPADQRPRARAPGSRAESGRVSHLHVQRCRRHRGVAPAGSSPATDLVLNQHKGHP